MATLYVKGKTFNGDIAALDFVVAAVANEARERAAIARGVLGAHRHQGHSRITVTHGDIDSFVNLDDTRGQLAAVTIEFGRTGTRGRGGRSIGVGALQAAMGAG